MPRFRLTIEYNGGAYVGWQRQQDNRAVQQGLEEAIQAMSGQSVETVAAGRTDAGVHARGQVVHFDLERDFTADRIRDGLNFHLSEPSALEEGEGPFRIQIILRHSSCESRRS